MYCPVCRSVLSPILLADQKSGASVDHCLNCCGSFWKKETLQHVSSGEVMRLSTIRSFPRKPFVTPEAISCPKDRVPMIPYEDHSVSGMSRCPTCFGIWVDQKILERYARQAEGKGLLSSVNGLNGKVIILSAIVGLSLILSYLSVYWSADKQIFHFDVLQKGKREYLSYPAKKMYVIQEPSGSVLVFLESSVPVQTTIRYGDEKENQAITVSEEFSTMHEATLTLLPQHQYWLEMSLTDETGNTYELPKNTIQTKKGGQSWLLFSQQSADDGS